MPEFRPTSEASYVAPWRLPRQDFHLLANNSFSGRAVLCPRNYNAAHGRQAFESDLPDLKAKVQTILQKLERNPRS